LQALENDQAGAFSGDGVRFTEQAEDMISERGRINERSTVRETKPWFADSQGARKLSTDG